MGMGSIAGKEHWNSVVRMGGNKNPTFPVFRPQQAYKTMMYEYYRNERPVLEKCEPIYTFCISNLIFISSYTKSLLSDVT